MRGTEFDARTTAASEPTIMVKTPSPPSPPTFNGKSDVQIWLFPLKLYFQVSRGYNSGENKIRSSVTLFKGPALKWRMSYLSTNNFPDSIDSFRDSVLSKYQPIDPMIKSRNRPGNKVCHREQ
jgi:hypothetical protein